MKIKIGKVSRLTYGLAATALSLALTAVAVMPSLVGQVSAAQVTSRSIELSDSKGGATSVSYQVGFTAPSNATIKGIVVDFCDNDPIIGDTCSAPSGFSLGTPSVTTSGAPNTGLSGTWSPSSSTTRTLILTNSTGTALNNTAVIFTINGVTNPTASDHSFYARILTYTSTTGATGYAPNGGEGSFTDYGGVALSTASVVNITAKVMETLSFCVFKTGGTCGQDPSITIGHAYGTATVIDSSAVDTSAVDFSLSTNAQSGVDVRLKGDTLKSGAQSLLAAGSSPQTISNGDATHQFGMRISTSGTNISPSSTYNGGSGSQYGFNTANTTSTYGDQICSLSGPTNNSVSTMTFAATAANTTPAGTYTSAEQLIATGKF